MDREKLLAFIRAAEADLASVRNSLLIVVQSGDVSGLERSRGLLARLGKGSLECGQPAVGAAVADCDGSIVHLAAAGPASCADINVSLDRLAALEATILTLSFDACGFLPNVNEFVEESFEHILPHDDVPEPARPIGDFELDEETLEIFRGEAEDLLAGIDANLEKLAKNASDQAALWEIRRNAHTLKGAAGIVGLRAAAEIAHRTEDLLDRLVEMRIEPPPDVINFLQASSRSLTTTVAGCGSNESDIDSLYGEALDSLSSRVSGPIDAEARPITDRLAPERIESGKPPAGPMVRVSLDRLDDLIKASRGLLINHSALAERFSDLCISVQRPSDLERLASLIDTQRRLTDEIQAKLLHIRMVKFGNLETRLARTVHVTCVDEGKDAAVEIQNGEVEVDTQVIDALIEPLLHLLKNAVVHGIEAPEVRRLIGKPEKGLIKVRVESDDNILVLSVMDDGAGISVAKLKERAIANGSLSREEADRMPDRDAVKLIFDRGLTTAEKIDLNAGRGVGMSIVKESIEASGGTVHVESELQSGAEFSLVLPLRSEPAASAARPADMHVEGLIAHADSPDRKPLVLIIDDSASIRRTTARQVEDAGYRAITANNGADALELLLNGDHEPDLILSDVEMPQIDGWEFLEYLKTDDNLGHIPVVMVTSLDTDEHRTRAFQLGASDYLVKPFNPDDVDRVLGIIALAVA